MRRVTRSLLAVAVAGVVSLSPAVGVADQPFVTTVYAHGHGGGHHGGGYGYGNGNCNGYGGGAAPCYYYCNGHEAHLHNNGVCPYAYTAPPVSTPAPAAPAKQTVSKSTVRKVQKRLNRIGYRCGRANGVMNAKTKKAVRRFKRDCGLRANCAIKKSVLRALGL